MSAEGGSSNNGSSKAVAYLAKLTAPLKHLEINPEELTRYEQIGCGSASNVFCGAYRGEYVAIKEMLFDDDVGGYDEPMINAFHRELDVWRTVEHPHVLKFKGLMNGSPFIMCSELCQGGTLFDLLHNCWEIPLSWDQRLKTLGDIAGAVHYLHNLATPVIHRDLKSLNVLLMAQVTGPESPVDVRLSDFGFARFCKVNAEVTATLTAGAGTMHWMAPEVSRGTRYHGKVDVFSFAIIMYEVVCRRVSFEDQDPEQAQELLASGQRADLGPDFVPADTPDGLVWLIQECWKQNPKERPSFQEICDHLANIPQA